MTVTTGTELRFGVNSMVAPLKRVALRRPGAILTADHRRWNYSRPLNPVALAGQYREFVELVRRSGAAIEWIDQDETADVACGLADSIFTYDPSFVTPAGAIIGLLGKELRRAESALHRAFYESASIPVIGEIEAPGTFEGGDCLWLNSETLAIGRTYRTNQEGIDQLRAILGDSGVGVESFDMPHMDGPSSCLHLLSVISPLDDNLALVYAPLVPVALYQRLVELDYELIHAPRDEFETSSGLSLNVLATAPRQLIAVSGFPRTAQLMIDAGCVVSTFPGDELCIPCEGGPTCLTRPLLREDRI